MTIKRGWKRNNKIRPVLVLSNNINNQYSATITVIPVTSNTIKIRSFEIFIPSNQANLPKNSKAKCDQIRTIDKSRFINEVGKLSQEYIIEIEYAQKKHLGM